MLRPEEAHSALVKSLRVYSPQKPSADQIKQFLDQSMVLDQAEQSNLRTIIFGYNDLTIYHINVGAARYFGATPEEILSVGTPWILGCMEEEQAKTIVTNSPIISGKMSKMKVPEMRNSFNNLVNWRISCPKGNNHRSHFQIFPIMFDENDCPVLGMYIIHDVEPFLIKDIWWCRYKLDDKIFVYHCENGQLTEGDILTPRESEILKLLVEGASSKEIASSLFLSVNTVDNHRRNMLKKTGAVDTSALIHICKLCQMV